jgi:hypothetical protein
MVAVQFVIAPIAFQNLAAGAGAFRSSAGNHPAVMSPVAAVIAYRFHSRDGAAGIGQFVAQKALFSIFCNWLIFSIFSALGRENPEKFPFVISNFPGLGNPRQTDNGPARNCGVSRL